MNDIIRAMLALALLSVLIAAAGCSLVYFNQDRAVFPGAWMDLHTLDLSDMPGAEAIEIPVQDAVVLKGWLLRPSGNQQAPLLIYFGGNAEEVSANAYAFRRYLPGWRVALVNYRGYAGSQGKPSEDALLADSLVLYDRLTQMPGIQITGPSGTVAVMGRSLGTGVAIYLATKRKVSALVLVSPYDSMSALARRHYPLLPSSLIKYQFNSMALAPHATMPVIVVTGTNDNIIPPAHSQALAAALAGPVSTLKLQGRGHNDISAHPGYWTGIADFLKNIMRGPAPAADRDYPAERK